MTTEPRNPGTPFYISARSRLPRASFERSLGAQRDPSQPGTRIYPDEALLALEKSMRRQLTLEYWKEDTWFVGQLPEVPGFFRQGKTLEELQESLQDALDATLTPAPPTRDRPN